MSLGPKEQYQVNKIVERKSSLILEYKYIHFQKKKVIISTTCDTKLFNCNKNYKFKGNGLKVLLDS